MPYRKNQSRLEALIAKALNEEEIQSGASQADLEIEVLREKFLEPGLEKKASRIWEAGADKIEEYNQLEKEYEAYLTGLRREEEQLRRSYLRIPRRGMVAILATLGLGLSLVALVIGLIVLGLIAAAGTIDLGDWTIVVLFSVTALLSYFAISRSLYRRYLVAKERYDGRLAEIQSERESNSLGEQLETVEQEVERTVIEGGILRELRDIIGAYSPSYGTNLTISSAPGLAEVFDPGYEIPTEPKEKLHRLLANMPGGSIGISGPRGVGKTTLLGSFCSKTSTTELEDRPVLSVMISAPVKYNPREFILHIFSSVCQRVLEIKGKKDPQSPWEHINGMRRPPVTFLSTIMDLKESIAVVALGLFLMSTLLVSNLLSPLKLSDFFLDFFVGLGLFLVLLGVVGLLIRTYQMLQERRQSQREKEKEQELYGDDLLVSKAFKWLGDIQFQQSYSSGWAGSLTANIAPVGVETTVDAAVELAKNQMSLPEIVDRYQEFLKLASKEYLIIIGIDEMDKMGSDEDAMNFLNEIKALFGLESCFYLISVSESAMSSFERRGLHFRDVFDSSFDAIIYADYLNLDRAHRLLRRRVIGVPVPFLDLCHCMVGGLPRDLIRVFRALYEEHMLSDSDENDLSTLCGALIRADLKAKLRATSIAAKKDGATEAEVDDLLERLRKLEALLDTADPLPTLCPGLLDGYTTLLASRASPELVRQGEVTEGSTAARADSLASLSTELAVYLYYSVTLVEFFGQENLDIVTLQRAERSGGLEQLARARQYFTISPRIAESAITEFRNQYIKDGPQGVSADSLSA